MPADAKTGETFEGKGLQPPSNTRSLTQLKIKAVEHKTHFLFYPLFYLYCEEVLTLSKTSFGPTNI